MQASIAERIAYGTPLDPVFDDQRVYNAPRPTTALVGRILLSAIFLVSGIAKLMDPGGSAGYMKAAGIGNADVLVYVAAAAEILGGLSLLFGILARLGGICLAVYLVIVSFYMHRFWGVAAPEAKMQMAQFMKNVSIIGGLLMVAAHGPGRYSVDARLRRPLQP